MTLNPIKEAIIFLGSGASAKFGIPTMEGMVTEFEETLNPEEKNIYNEICQILKSCNYSIDLELIFTVLSDTNKIRLENINPELAYFIKKDSKTTDLNYEVKKFSESTDGKLLSSLGDKLKNFLIQACSPHGEYLSKIYGCYDELFKTIGAMFKVNPDNLLAILRSNKTDIFTTNYDIVVESYIKRTSNKFSDDRLFNDGSISEAWKTLNFLNDDRRIRLFKLHGSIDQFRTEDGIVKTGKRNALVCYMAMK